MLLGAESLMFDFEVMDAIIDLISEKIVENSICCCDDDVSVLEFLRVVVSILRLVLDHVVVHRFEDMAQFFEFFESPFLFKHF